MSCAGPPKARGPRPWPNWPMRESVPARDGLGSAGPEATLVLGPQAGVTCLAVCLKSVNLRPSYV